MIHTQKNVCSRAAGSKGGKREKGRFLKIGAFPIVQSEASQSLSHVTGIYMLRFERENLEIQLQQGSIEGLTPQLQQNYDYE